MNRRTFLDTSSKVLFLLTGGLASLGVSCGSVFAAIAGYVGAGIDAATSVVNLLAGAGIITLPEGTLISVVLTAIKAGWADVTAAVADYNNAPAADKQTFAGKVATALAAVQSEIQKFWADLSIPNPQLANTIAGLLGLIVSTIAGFLVYLPKPQPIGPAPAPTSKMLKIIPKKMSQADFRKEFNSILASGGYSKYAI